MRVELVLQVRRVEPGPRGHKLLFKRIGRSARYPRNIDGDSRINFVICSQTVIDQIRLMYCDKTVRTSSTFVLFYVGEGRIARRNGNNRGLGFRSDRGMRAVWACHSTRGTRTATHGESAGGKQGVLAGAIQAERVSGVWEHLHAPDEQRLSGRSRVGTGTLSRLSDLNSHPVDRYTAPWREAPARSGTARHPVAGSASQVKITASGDERPWSSSGVVL